jgi:hypothetical protein
MQKVPRNIQPPYYDRKEPIKAEGEFMDNYNTTQFHSGIELTSEKPPYLNENLGRQEQRNLSDGPFRLVTGVIIATPISLFFWFTIFLIYWVI